TVGVADQNASASGTEDALNGLEGGCRPPFFLKDCPINWRRNDAQVGHQRHRSFLEYLGIIADEPHPAKYDASQNIEAGFHLIADAPTQVLPLSPNFVSWPGCEQQELTAGEFDREIEPDEDVMGIRFAYQPGVAWWPQTIEPCARIRQFERRIGRGDESQCL